MDTMKFWCWSIVALLSTMVGAQNFTAQWEGHYSYNAIKEVAYGPSAVYAAAENAVFRYDLNSGERRTITTVNGLSGEIISSLYYSARYQTLVIGYENGFIELLQPEQSETITEVFTAIDIQNKPTIPDNQRRINHFFEHEGILLVSTDFGIIEFNLQKLEFGDTFFVGVGNSAIPVAQSAVFGDQIFAATASNGLLRANLNSPDLIDAVQWTTVLGGSYYGIQVLEDRLVALNTTRELLQYNGSSFQNIFSFSVPVLGIRASVGATLRQFTAWSGTRVWTFDKNVNLIAEIKLEDSGIGSSFTTAVTLDTNVFYGTASDGLLMNTPDGQQPGTAIQPEGPLLNTPFDLVANQGDLWVVFGEHTAKYNPFPLNNRGFSHRRQGKWIPFSHQQALGTDNLSYVTIHPQDSNRALISSFGFGILDVQDDQVVAKYNSTNSTIDPYINEKGEPLANIARIAATAFDAQGRLWITNSLSEHGFQRLDLTEGTVLNVDVQDIIPQIGKKVFGPLIVGPLGNVYVGSLDDGVIAYQPDRNLLVKVKGNLGGGNLPSDDIRTLALDTNDQLWIGSSDGLRIINNPSTLFNQVNPTTERIVIIQDGVPQELLFGQFVNDIQVDGANNKWLATGSSGVFHVSPDGQETLHHFTRENSPLPSNNVRTVAIDGASGIVYLGTDKGIVAYRGAATTANANLDALRAFPNPVRPEYEGGITVDGLTQGANVKITDIEGNLVHEVTSEGGSIQWDTSAFGRHRVASGVYLILVTAEDSTETKVAKLMIIR